MILLSIVGWSYFSIFYYTMFPIFKCMVLVGERLLVKHEHLICSLAEENLKPNDDVPEKVTGEWRMDVLCLKNSACLALTRPCSYVIVCSSDIVCI